MSHIDNALQIILWDYPKDRIGSSLFGKIIISNARGCHKGIES